MKVDFQVIHTQKVNCGWFWSYWNKCIAKGIMIISECERLQIHDKSFFQQWDMLKMYLIICRDQLSYSFKSMHSCEFTETCHRLKVQWLLCLLLCHYAPLGLLFLFPPCPSKCPTGSLNDSLVCLLCYISSCRSCSADEYRNGRRNPSFVKCLLLTIQFCELFILLVTH
jgi:hypothetical protein